LANHTRDSLILGTFKKLMIGIVVEIESTNNTLEIRKFHWELSFYESQLQECESRSHKPCKCSFQNGDCFGRASWFPWISIQSLWLWWKQMWNILKYWECVKTRCRTVTSSHWHRFESNSASACITSPGWIITFQPSPGFLITDANPDRFRSSSEHKVRWKPNWIEKGEWHDSDHR
jgi:hypothetical protein